jgi:F0F1-type ATP synthase membrane subunit b/b'
MEGSVKSLIEAEEEARKIVEEAQKQRLQMKQDADTKANQLITLREQHYEKQLNEETAKVISLLIIIIIISSNHSCIEID